MRVRLRRFYIFFFLIFFCNTFMALGSATIPESDILRKGETPGGKKETFDGFSDIFGTDDFKTSVDKPMDFFSLYCGREFFNYTFTWDNFFDKLKSKLKLMLSKKDETIVKSKKPDGEDKKFDPTDSRFYRYAHRFFKSPGRWLLDGLTFLIFSQRAFLGMDMLVEYSFFLKKKFFFTLRLGWDYNDFSFKNNEDFLNKDVLFKESSSGAYEFKDMTEQKALEFYGGNTDSFESEKKKVDSKYYKELLSVRKKNKNLQAKRDKIFGTEDDVFVFTSLYKYFLDFGVSYYNNPRNPAKSTFIFRFLIKLNAFYNVTGIDYVIASNRGVISHFTVDDVINKHVSSPRFGCKVCLCFGYKNWEAEISVALYSSYKEKDKCSGQFVSETLQKRCPLSIAVRNRIL